MKFYRDDNACKQSHSWKFGCCAQKSSLLWPRASRRIYYHRTWGQLSTTCSNVLKQPNGELIVAVNHNQLRTTASETVDPIDWSHPPPSWAVPPERLVQSINQCNLSGNRTCNRSMRGNHLAYAATQGINFEKFTSTNLEGPITVERLKCWTLFLDKFIEVNFLTLTHNNQIFRNDFVSIHYHLCNILPQIIDCKFLVSIYELSRTLHAYNNTSRI